MSLHTAIEADRFRASSGLDGVTLWGWVYGLGQSDSSSGENGLPVLPTEGQQWLCLAIFITDINSSVVTPSLLITC